MEKIRFVERGAAVKLYFKDNFLSAGKTAIYDEQQAPAGELDLRSAFSSSIDIYDSYGALKYRGKFTAFSGKWEISDAEGAKIGRLRYRLSFLKKRYEYEAYDRGETYEITSPALSKEYTVLNSRGAVAAYFRKTSSWMSAGAYCLENQSNELNNYELIAVIMGVNAIQKRQQSNNHGA